MESLESRIINKLADLPDEVLCTGNKLFDVITEILRKPVSFKVDNSIECVGNIIMDEDKIVVYAVSYMNAKEAMSVLILSNAYDLEEIDYRSYVVTREPSSISHGDHTPTISNYVSTLSARYNIDEYRLRCPEVIKGHINSYGESKSFMIPIPKLLAFNIPMNRIPGHPSFCKRITARLANYEIPLDGTLVTIFSEIATEISYCEKLFLVNGFIKDLWVVAISGFIVNKTRERFGE